MKIAIVGAGLSGLACAFRLEQQNFQGTIDIFEKKPVVGGGNIFLEFVSEMFHRPIEDFFSYIAREYQLHLTPLHKIMRTQLVGPTKSTLYEGYTGYVVVRGNHTDSLEKQLAAQIHTPVMCSQHVCPDDIKADYDYVVIATGRLQDVPSLTGVRLDRYVHFYHGIMKGSFDVNLSRLFFNDSYALKGNAFQLTLDADTSMIALATPVRDFNLEKAWKRFVQTEFGGEGKLLAVHEIRDFAIGQPMQYSCQNQLFVGNVAGGVQPALGFGLHTAILSGIYAADSILKNKDYAVSMARHSREYRWSLALRNALERLENPHYDLLVEGAGTALGRAVLQKGGFNLNRYLGKVLAAMSNETEKSIYPEKLNPYMGRTVWEDR